MVTAVEGNNFPVKLRLFRNYRLPLNDADNQRMGYRKPEQELLWYAARCSSAAPTYFSSVDSKYVDGGLISNNPTLDLLSEVHTLNMAAKYADKLNEIVEIGCVVSVGTGRVPDKAINSLDIGMPSSYTDAFLTVVAAKELKNILIDQVTATDGRPVDRSRSWCHGMGVPFFRFSTPLSKDIELDETNDCTLIEMLWETEVYMRTEQSNEVKCLAEVLLKYFYATL